MSQPLATFGHLQNWIARAAVRFCASAIVCAAAAVSPALGDDFEDVITEPFGVFAGIEYVRHTGVFEGASALGAFRVPFEVVAPADPGRGENTLLFEPPHSGFSTIGRDFILGFDLIFNRGLRFASVGIGNWSELQILDPSVPDLVLAGKDFVVADPLTFPSGFVIDERIVALFVNALESDADMAALLGPIDRRYAYGISESAAVIQELMFDPDGLGQGLFDLSFLHTALWRPFFGLPGLFDNLPDGSPVPVAYDYPTGVGRVMIVNTEGDALISDSEFYQCAVHRPDFRLYEVSGAAHVPTSDAVPVGNNPLDHFAVMRAIFVQGDNWLRRGAPPARSRLMTRDPASDVDPGCFRPTGISRDEDNNARGGVRLPDLQLGRATYIASDPASSFNGLPGLLGDSIDLSCALDKHGRPRFKTHFGYVLRLAIQTIRLRRSGFLLEADAEFLVDDAIASNVGKPGNCNQAAPSQSADPAQRRVGNN
jgi:hypothetical protein